MRPICACLVPGGSPYRWLSAANRLGIDLGAVTFYVLPTSDADLTPSSVLIVAAGIDASPVPGLHAYGVEFGRLYLPVNATLYPQLTPEELSRVFLYDLSVYHPGLGLVGFDASDGCKAVDILLPPEKRASSWTHARPGPVPIRFEVETIRLQDPPQVDDVIDDVKGDIGSRSIDELSPSSDEPGLLGKAAHTAGQGLLKGISALAGAIADVTSGAPSQVDDVEDDTGSPASGDALPSSGSPGILGRIGRAVGSGLRKGISALVGAVAGGMAAAGASGGNAGRSRDRGRSGGNWARALQNWSERQMDRLYSLRERELQRLLKLLETNPREGLKYALPVGDGMAHRGVAQPGTRLFAHKTTFSLTGLGGGAAADIWGVDSRRIYQLRETYRRLAEQHLAEGDVERAAYVYAHLLSDFAAAAGALEKGGRYREAAVLYKEKLHNPKESARCLEQGGLLLEAADLWSELGDHLAAGDLYDRIELSGRARAAWRRAVEVRLSVDNRLKAAAILDDRLKEPEEALAVLKGGWPDGVNPAGCLSEGVKLLTRLDRRPEAVGLLTGAVRLPVMNSRQTAAAMDALRSLYDQPDPVIRQTASDEAFGLVGRQTTTTLRSSGLLDRLPKFDVDDPLLKRDCARHLMELQQRTPATRSRPATARTSGGAVIVRIKTSFRLPELPGGTWRTALVYRQGLVSAGCSRRGMHVCCADWRGRTQMVSWKSGADIPAEAAEPAAMLIGSGSGVVFLALLDGSAVPPRTLGAAHLGGRDLTITTPPIFQRHLLGATLTEFGTVVTLRWEDGEIILETANRDGIVESSRSLGCLAPTDHFVPFAVRRNTAHLAFGDTLLAVDDTTLKRVVDACGSPITSVVASPPFTATRFALTLTEGVILVRPKRAVNPGDETSLAPGIAMPVVGFSLGGRLLVAGAQHAEVYRTDQNDVRRVATILDLPGKPIAVLPGDDAATLALVFDDGLVRLYQVP